MKHTSPTISTPRAPAMQTGGPPSEYVDGQNAPRQAAATLGRRRILALAGAAAVAGLIGSSGVAEARSCQEAAVAECAGAAFLAAARAGTAPAFARALAAHVDMQKVTLFALGRYRQQLPANRRAQLVKLTSGYASGALADFASSFRGSSIQMVSCRPGEVVSRLEFRNRSARRVVWRINGGKVVDVNVQNMWLSHVLRDNYTSVIRRGGGSIEALFLDLKSRQTHG